MFGKVLNRVRERWLKHADNGIVYLASVADFKEACPAIENCCSLSVVVMKGVE